MKKGNKGAGRPFKQAIKETKQPGIFYINEHSDWIVGGVINDNRDNFYTPFVKPYSFAPNKQRRIY